MKKVRLFKKILAVLFMVMTPLLAMASVESTLSNMQDKLINTVLPAVSIFGLVGAGISFAVGSENAKKHAILAVVGTILGFAAPSVIHWVQGFAN